MILALAVALLGAVPAHPRPVVGVKVYETARAPAGLFDEWRGLGINTVFASVALNHDPAFREHARRTAIARFVIVPVFFDPETLKSDPGLRAITAGGEPAVEEWVEFACPTREAYRRKKIDL